ncbi:MAG: YebC/PmpR family DNA-binding transcriptional regulator [Candidatus Eisenbacteria bacterium]|uniref:Probable transcriptional regulatory protein HZA61_13360 n=1 Tax=Eiseniibacteriota bacterium TaxID=2212470 RepID=A0A933W2V3_UNCEI|nr:YebC/PmpR family DNA-binding transcriptional regulator [Candidatus Eisenbacteria bacterium]
MSGHSKWSTIKRKKAATDAARGKVFTKYIREITLAARAGGGDPDANPRLRTAISGAKSVNMPVANIERAVQKGTGQLEGSVIEEVTYEGYGPHGVAILVECATDNRNRATGDVRHAFSKYGGNMGEAGSVSYLFKPRGVLTVALDAATEDTVMEVALEAGAEDIVTGAEAYEITTPVAALEPVREALLARGVSVSSAEATKIASVHVPLGEKEAPSVLRLVGILEDLDDVQQVYANFDIPDEVLAKLSH